MKTTKYTTWQAGEFFIESLNDYPAAETQGYSKEELFDNWKSLLSDIETVKIYLI